jgi:hypothetical protein
MSSPEIAPAAPPDWVVATSLLLVVVLAATCTLLALPKPAPTTNPRVISPYGYTLFTPAAW